MKALRKDTLRKIMLQQEIDLSPTDLALGKLPLAHHHQQMPILFTLLRNLLLMGQRDTFSR